jgi:hypothetical protein
MFRERISAPLLQTDGMSHLLNDGRRLRSLCDAA